MTDLEIDYTINTWDYDAILNIDNLKIIFPSYNEVQLEEWCICMNNQEARFLKDVFELYPEDWIELDIPLFVSVIIKMQNFLQPQRRLCCIN